MLTTLAILQWVGTILGIAGGYLVPQKGTRARFWGFLVWGISDIAMIVVLGYASLWPSTLMFAYFTACSAFGCWNHRK